MGTMDAETVTTVSAESALVAVEDSGEMAEEVEAGCDDGDPLIGQQPAMASAQKSSHWLRALSWRGRTVLFIVCFAAYCESAVYSCLAPFFPLEAVKRGATETEIALIIGIFQLVVFLFAPLFGKYVTHFGAKFLFVSGLLVCGCSMCIFGLLQYCPAGPSYVGSAFAIRIVEALGGAAYLTGE